MKPEQRTEQTTIPVTLPEAGMDQGQEIQVKRGLGERALERIGLDSASLAEAGVLRANQAQTAQDTARGLKEPGGLSEDAKKRAEQIRSGTPEYIEPVNKHPL
jgi:hypothetical protein